MSNKRKKVCNHISAAKTWLTQAENSLDMDNDIRGDLNLMLAQAELKQAQEAQRRKKKIVWLKGLAPVIVALVLATIWLVTVNWLGQEEVQPVVAEPVVTQTTTETPATNTATNTATAPNLLQKPQESNNSLEIVNRATETVGLGELSENNPIQVVQPPQTQEPNIVAETPKTVEPPVNQVPSEEKQQMMQMAGQLLRE